MRLMLVVVLFAFSSAAQACSFGAGRAGSFDIYFERGESTLNGLTGLLLDEVASQLAGCRVILVVSGHRDASEVGMLKGVRLDDIGQARADSVRQWLQEKGFAPLDILVRDVDTDRPQVATPPGAAEARNRRVELTVVSL